MQPKCNSRLFWREIAKPPASCKAEAAKESIKTKPESGNCFCIRVFLSIKLRLIVMSTDLEYRARERQRVIVVQNNGKVKYKKSVLHVQSCFFAN